MKKKAKIIITILLAILLLFGWFVYTQWNSIEALIHSFGTTVEDTEKEIEATKQELQDFIDNEEDITVRDLTEEEAKALSEGNLSEEEVIGILTGKTPEPVKTPVPNKKPSTVQTPTPTQNPTSEEIISQLIAKLYIQKSTYLNKLDAIEAQVRAEFIATEDEWSSRKEAKQVYLKKYLPVVANWEKTCDSVVYGILDEIRAELKKVGRDESVVDTMKSSYLEEKKLKKTYFINRYMD